MKKEKKVMKKGKMSVLLFVAVTVFAVLCMALVGCGGAASSTGVYTSVDIVKSGQVDGEDQFSTIYRLEFFDDNTYELTLTHWWILGNGQLSLSYGRNVISYGTYSVTGEDVDAGTKNVSVAVPTRVQMTAFHRGKVVASVDSAKWPAGNAEEEIEAGFSYKLYERADVEVWETADAFVKGYGKAYNAVYGSDGSMTITLADGYEQIPFGNAVMPVESAA